DRYVLEEMTLGGYSIGWEQSGHAIIATHAPTGLGELTALHLLQRLVATGRTARKRDHHMTRLPPSLIDAKCIDRPRAPTDRGVTDAIAAAEREQGETGRVLLRPSGTEPVVRVMVEAPHDDQATEIAERLAGVVRERVGL